MKRTKLFLLIAILVVASFTLTGCFFGSDGADSDVEENDHYQLDLKIRGEGEVKDLEEGKHEFEKDVVVDLEAVADEEWKFKEWQGDVSESNKKKTSIFMDKNKKLVAVFEEVENDQDNEDPDSYDLSLNLDKTDDNELTYEITGNSDPEVYFFDFYVDGDFVGGDGSPEQTSKSETIEYTFDNSKAGEEVEVRLDVLNLDNEVLESKTKTVTLDEIDEPSPETYELTIDVNGQGSTNPSVDAHTYEEGEEVTISTSADSGWYFDRWSGDSDSSDSQITVTMDKNKSVTANFLEEDDPDPANFDVTINNTNSPITEGDTLEVDATVENTGDESATKQVDLLIDSTKKDSENVNLNGGESTTITLSWSSQDGDAGDYTALVYSGDMEVSNSITVDEKTVDPDPANFDVTINNTNSPITEGDTLEVDATVENNGEESDSQEVDLLIDGEVKDSKTISLSEGSSETLTLYWSTSVGEDGDYTVKVESNDDSVTKNVTVDKESTDDEVSFTYDRLESLEYEFAATKPEGATYWEWKFPNEDYWQGYDGQNTITHSFDSSGDKTVKLRILDEDENIIGEYEDTINVD